MQLDVDNKFIDRNNSIKEDVSLRFMDIASEACEHKIRDLDIEIEEIKKELNEVPGNKDEWVIDYIRQVSEIKHKKLMKLKKQQKQRTNSFSVVRIVKDGKVLFL